MYSVYLLDDEPFILQGLEYIVPWEELGFKIVGSAPNGQVGFDEIIKKDIDLIITDIMMPKMTGLELIEKLKESNYDFDFIVLSAFQEFEYAKKAINMGAENYILKPIDADELLKNLKSIYQKLREKENLHIDNEVVKNNLLLNTITHKYNENTKLNFDRLDIKSEKSQRCIAIIETKNKDYNLANVLKNDIKYHKYKYCMQTKSRALIVIEDEEGHDIITNLTNLKNDVVSISNETVYISLGKVVDSIENINLSYTTADDVSEYKIVYPNISWIKEYKEGNSSVENIEIDLEELKKILVNKEFSKTINYIDNIFKNIKDKNLAPNQIKLKSIEVFLNVYNYFNETKLMKGLNIYLEKAINSNTVDEVELELTNMVKFMQSKLENTEESMSPVILKLLKHIEENYQNDLNLKEISENLNINSIYLGQLFQKETGILFSDYINNFRINKAKDLLINTSLKASDIGDLVGYANKNYFYRKFKSLVGITPSEWRKINI
ncbi:MAG: response regulator transcription factor [Peptostreptococcaceae bacterium]